MVAPTLKVLTAWQRQVAARLAVKRAISEVTQSPDTTEVNVRIHMRAVVGKLGIESRPQLRAYVVLLTREQGKLYYSPEADRKKLIRIDVWLNNPDSQTEIGTATGGHARESNDVSGSVGAAGIRLAFQNEKMQDHICRVRGLHSPPSLSLVKLRYTY